jgi:hypothetical protein
MCQDGIAIVPELSLGTLGVTLRIDFLPPMIGNPLFIRVLVAIELPRQVPPPDGPLAAPAGCVAAHVAIEDITLLGFQVTFSIEPAGGFGSIPIPDGARVHWNACSFIVPVNAPAPTQTCFLT